MQRFEIQRLLPSGIPEVATFLYKQDGVPQLTGRDPKNLERRLRWFLLENPWANSGFPFGFCVRDGAGAIRGLTLCCPNVFLAGDRRLVGLGSGNFFVDPAARTMGFYLFKTYLSSPGCSFYFTTTCNSNSGPLWEKLGGFAVRSSELEYVLPLKLDALIRAILPAKTSCGVRFLVGSVFGRWANWMARIRRKRPARLKLERCYDWQRLSRIFERCRSADSITTERSPEFLEWRYGRSSDAHPAGVYLMRDGGGHEGWFALGNVIRGRLGEIRGSVLLDAIWPRDTISFQDIFAAIVDLVAGRSDVLLLPSRAGLDYSECSRWVIRRGRPAASSFVIGREADPRWLAATLDLSFADGDSALPVHALFDSEGATRGEIVEKRLPVA